MRSTFLWMTGGEVNTTGRPEHGEALIGKPLIQPRSDVRRSVIDQRTWTHHNGILPPAMVGVLAFLRWVCSLSVGG
jgi:hypothetical protein